MILRAPFVARLPKGVNGHEADQRFARLEAPWKDNEAFCRRLGREVEWTDMALWASKQIKRGELRIPIPPIDEILPSYSDRRWPGRLDLVIGRYADEDGVCHYPSTVDELEPDEAAHIGYYFRSKAEECLQRNEGRTDAVSDVAIPATAKKLEISKLDEGFDEPWYVRIVDGRFVVEEWNDEI